MLAEYAWQTFKNTGDIYTYMFYKEIENLKGTNENVRKLNMEASQEQSM